MKVIIDWIFNDFTPKALMAITLLVLLVVFAIVVIGRVVILIIHNLINP